MIQGILQEWKFFCVFAVLIPAGAQADYLWVASKDAKNPQPYCAHFDMQLPQPFTMNTEHVEVKPDWFCHLDDGLPDCYNGGCKIRSKYFQVDISAFRPCKCGQRQNQQQPIPSAASPPDVQGSKLSGDSALNPKEATSTAAAEFDKKHPEEGLTLGKGASRRVYIHTVGTVQYATYDVHFPAKGDAETEIKYQNAIHELKLLDDLKTLAIQTQRPLEIVQHYGKEEVGQENVAFRPLFKVYKPGDLRKLIQNPDFPWSSYQILTVARLCQTVITLHANNFVHRDIKPSNILVEEIGNSSLQKTFNQKNHLILKLADFGLAYQYGEDFTRDKKFFLPNARSILFSHPKFLTALETLSKAPYGFGLKRRAQFKKKAYLKRDMMNDRWGFGITLLSAILRRDPRWITDAKKDAKSAETLDMILSSLSQKQVDDEIQMAEKILANLDPPMANLPILMKLLRASLKVDPTAPIKRNKSNAVRKFTDACEALGG